MSKFVIVLFVFKAVVLFSGCATASGTGRGLRATASEFKQGVSEDAKFIPGAIMSLDRWIRENMW